MAVVLRVRAEGARGLAAAGGLLGAADRKPDPYVVFSFGGATRQCAHVDDVAPLLFFQWPSAEAEFPVKSEAEIGATPLVVHVKDKDLVKDRFIGGAAVDLGRLLAAAAAANEDGERVLCRSLMVPLEFADEKHKAKSKQPGEVQLTIVLVDSKAKEAGKQEKRQDTEKTAPAAAKPEESRTNKEQPGSATVASSATEAKKEDALAAPATASYVGSAPEPSQPLEAKTATRRDSQPTVNNTADTSIEQISDLRTQARPNGVPSPGLTTAEASTPNVTISPRPTPPADKGLEAKPPDAVSAQATTSDSLIPIKRLHIELVSARNLTRPTSLGALFDRKPDPFVVLDFAGVTMSSTPLKDVDIKQLVQWSNAALSFDMPTDVSLVRRPKGINPADLIIHVKDENLTKATYMGGAKVSLDEFFQVASNRWITAFGAVDGVERVYPLVFGDEKLKKRKECGEITLRFRFEQDAVTVVDHESASSTTLASLTPNASPNQPFVNDVLPVEPTLKGSSSPDPITSVLPEGPQSIDSQPAEKFSSTLAVPIEKVCTDVQSLSIEVLCARQLKKPIVPSGFIKGALKAVFDRKPDPYVVLTLDGHPSKKTSVVKDADVAFIEWKNAAQVFEFKEKPYPSGLTVHVRDHDTVGTDPFMGGSRIQLQPVWDASVGTTELVKTYPLEFADEQMTKHQACGEITIRFQWVYASEPLPIASLPILKKEGDVQPKELKQDEPPVARMDTKMLRYMCFYNLRLVNNPGVISTSHDLYVEVSCLPLGMTTDSSKQRVMASTSVLTDASKGIVSDGFVEWKDDRLVLPVALPMEHSSGTQEIVVELKDKNAITKDTRIAHTAISLAEFVALIKSQKTSPSEITLSLTSVSSVGGRSKKEALKVSLSAMVSLFPLEFPELLPAQSEAATMTFFALSGDITWNTPLKEGIRFGLVIQIAGTKASKGLLSVFSRPHTEDQIDFYSLSSDQSVVEWCAGFDTLVSSKQLQTARDKETLDIDVQLWCVSDLSSGKNKGSSSAAMVSSYRVSGWEFLSCASSVTGNNAIKSIELPLGQLGGSMAFSYSISFRKAQSEVIRQSKGSTKLTQEKEAPLGSGNLHLLVMYAQDLVPPAGSDEKEGDLDPEVRVSIEPKYVKRKENPVRAMLKTRPLENAGVTPTWNEYLRLEYRLPLSSGSLITSTTPESGTTPETNNDDFSFAVMPAPIVTIGVYDIQIVGERSGSAVIGKTEIPLNAFVLPHISPSVMQPLPFYTTVDLHLKGKKTGRLTFEGVFEPIVAASSTSAAPGLTEAGSSAAISNNDKNPGSEEGSYRILCRTIGRSLKERAKQLQTSDSAPVDEGNKSVLRYCTPGRLEVHVERALGSTLLFDNGPVIAHLWMASAVDDRKELRSCSRVGGADANAASEQSGVEWDSQITLYTFDLATDILRVELLSMAGKSLGSLKHPVSGLQSHPNGKMTHESYQMIPPIATIASSSRKKRNDSDVRDTLQLGIAFYPDQRLCEPVADSSILNGSSAEHTSIFLQFGRFIFASSAISELESATLTCKVAFFGSTGSAATAPPAVTTKPKPILLLNVISYVDWDDELVCIDLETSVSSLIAASYSIGTCPIVRLEFLLNRKGTRFNEVVVAYEMSFAGLLSKKDMYLKTWVTLYAPPTPDKKHSLVGVMRLGVAVVGQQLPRPANPFSQVDSSAGTGNLERLHSVPGVFCVRFIAGRNLIDVDANGEQDPYVVARIQPLPRPIRGLDSASCQTSVSLNGGRHPQWNSQVFYLNTSDLWMDYLRLEVIDSNEEDHIPDASIGGLSIALATLFNEFTSTLDDGGIDPTKGKTLWMEAWLPIYPLRDISTKVALVEPIESVGDIRVEYRFISQEYFRISQLSSLESTLPSLYAASANDKDPIEVDALPRTNGSMHLHIVGALDLPIAPGVQPAVRITCPETGFVHVTPAGKQSIRDPVWNTEMTEIPFVASSMRSRSPTIFIEIVDLAVRTANINALAVITFGSINIDAFIRHPTATSYGFYTLGNNSQTHACLFLGCQFVSTGQHPECIPFTNKLSPDNESKLSRGGQIHVKAVQLRFDLPHYFQEMIMCNTPILRFKLLAVGTSSDSSSRFSVTLTEKTIPVPKLCASIPSVVAGEGYLDWVTLSEEQAGTQESSNVILFEWNPSPGILSDSVHSIFQQRANPVVVCELVLSNSEKDAKPPVTSVIGELELPIFDFVLIEGHLLSGWYPLSAPDGNLEPGIASQMSCPRKCGNINLEVQFLPTLVAASVNEPSTLKPLSADSLVMLEFHIEQVKEFLGANLGAYSVSVELMGCRAETRPPASVSRNSLVWGEVLDLAVPAVSTPGSKVVTFKLCNLSKPDQQPVATCNWVLPGEFLLLSSTQSETVVLQLFVPDSTQQSSNKEVVADLELHVRKPPTGDGRLHQITAPKSLETQQRGVLYALFNRPKLKSNELSVSAAIVPTSTTQEQAISAQQCTTDATTVFISMEYGRFGGISVIGLGASLQHKLAVVIHQESSSRDIQKAAVGYAELSEQMLRALVSQPRVEMFQRISLQPALALPIRQQGISATLPSETPEGSLPTTLSARLVFLNVLRGHFLVAFQSAKSSNVHLEFFTQFRFELRLLHCRSAWQTSSLGSWSKHSSSVEWRCVDGEDSRSRSLVKIEYSNETMTAEPALQVVLFGITSKRPSKGGNDPDDCGVRIAYGQISMLGILTEQGWDGTFLDRKIELSSVNASSNVSDDNGIVEVNVSMGFIGVEATNDEIEAQLVQTRNEQIMLLAEGTAKLKKAFVVLGGDEETPVSVSSLKHYLLNTSSDDTADLQAARQVIFKAAEQETEGDLDRLFELMDVNGDGQISWSEYTNHMQTLFALANATAMRSLLKERSVQENNQEDVNDNSEEEAEPHLPVNEPMEAESEDEDDEHPDPISTKLFTQQIPSRSDAGGKVDQYEDSPPASTKEDSPVTRKQSIKPIDEKPKATVARAVAQTGIGDNELDDSGADGSRQKATTIKQSQIRSKRTDTAAPVRKPLSTNVLDWKVDEVLQWLDEEMELPQYGEAIIRNAVSGRLLLTLSESELESELGVKTALHKRKLVTHIAELQEVADYPPLQRSLEATERNRTNRAKTLRPNTTETPSFIRREQLLFQAKKAAAQPEVTPFNTSKIQKKRPAVTTLVLGHQEQALQTTTGKAKSMQSPSDNKRYEEDQDDGENVGESFEDAMQDILEAVGPSTPKSTGIPQEVGELGSTTTSQSALTKLPLIQIGSITSTDELFEIVKNRVHQLADQLRPLQALQDSDTFSDFGEPTDDEIDNKGAETTEELTGLRLAFNALASSHAKEAKLSRLRFQKSLLSLLAVDASWHQFDLLFRRVDANNNAELSFEEFQRVFRRAFVGFEAGDLTVLQDALVDLVIERLDSQQWTLLELFKAFDRDGGGNISVAEFGSLVRFLLGRRASRPLDNRQIYLLLSCIDVSSDHRIARQEFLRFFFVVWSARLMLVQDALFHLEQRQSQQQQQQLEALNASRRRLRRALRTNFSRPFRDAMRCLDAQMPSPFAGLLSKLQLMLPAPPPSGLEESAQPPVQVWQVLKGEQSTAVDARAPVSSSSFSSPGPQKKPKSARNEVLRARLTRQRAPAREGAELRAAGATLALDQAAQLKRDRRRG